jgi:hypothetical protein
MKLISFLKRDNITFTGTQPAPKQTALQNVRIASPCSANWEQMMGDDRVRFCAGCQMNVYNLSEMTRREAERLVASREGRLCVRYYQRADGTVLTRNCPKSLQVAARQISRIGSAIVSMAMTIGCGFTPINRATGGQTMGKIAQQSTGTRIKVVDASGAPIRGARVEVEDEKGRKIASSVTGFAGRTDLFNLHPDVYVIYASAPNFHGAQQTVRVTNAPANFALTLSPLATVGDVMVVQPASIETEPAASPKIDLEPLLHHSKTKQHP